jgi:hypothetical protein
MKRNCESYNAFPSRRRQSLFSSGAAVRKTQRAMLRLLSLVPDETAWVTTALKQSDIRALLKTDAKRDKSGDIAERWLTAVQAHFAAFGRDLRPAMSTGRSPAADQA